MSRRRKPAARAALQAQTIYQRRFRDAKPINFGKASPKHLAVHGVDVSRWQGKIDWAKLRGQGANFAYIKATDGGDHLDPMFRKNWRAADAGRPEARRLSFLLLVPHRRRAGRLVHPQRAEGRGRAAAGDRRRVERRIRAASGARRAPRCWRRCRSSWTSWSAHYGQRPIIYTAPGFLPRQSAGRIPDYPFWLRAVAPHPSKVYPGRKWVFWQYSGSGLSHGVKGRIDLNVFHGSEEDWHDWVAG